MPEVKNNLSFITPTLPKPEYPLFIFLPGMDGTGQLYQRQANRLAKFFDIRCLSISPDDMSDWNSLAESAIALIKKELLLKQGNRNGKSPSSPSPRPPVYLCGESFGGCLALKLALEAPWLFGRLILVNPSSSFNQRPLLSWGIHFTQWMPEFFHSVSSLGLLPFLAALERMATSDRLALLEAMNSVPPRVVSWRLSLLRDFAVFGKDLRRLTQPMLILASRGDRLLPSIEEAKRLVNYLSHAQAIVLPHSGHACLLETDIYLDEIMQANHFLEEQLTKERC